MASLICRVNEPALLLPKYCMVCMPSPTTTVMESAMLEEDVEPAPAVAGGEAGPADADTDPMTGPGLGDLGGPLPPVLSDRNSRDDDP